VRRAVFALRLAVGYGLNEKQTKGARRPSRGRGGRDREANRVCASPRRWLRAKRNTVQRSSLMGIRP
jgi:hypothetical protein